MSSSQSYVFCVNDKFADFIRVPILSILYNNSNEKVNIYIITDYISEYNKKNIKQTSNLFNNSKIEFLIIDDKKLKHLKTGNWPIHAWYRILIPELLDNKTKRVLYLDADTLVLQNLSKLFNLNLSNKSIAASIDYQDLFDYPFERCGYSKEKQYICSGIMLINLDYWRKNNLTEKIIKWAKDNEDNIKCPDQDAINFICQDSKIILPMKYGVMDCFLINPIFKEAGYSKQIQECIDNPIIIHFNGCPPWYKEYNRHTLHNEWEKYNQMLEKPVKRHYQAKGILKVKIILNQLLNKVGIKK